MVDRSLPKTELKPDEVVFMPERQPDGRIVVVAVPTPAKEWELRTGRGR